MRNLRKMPSPNSVGAGQTATFDLPTGAVKYHSLMFKYQESGAPANQANIETDLTEIRINVNGRTQRVFSAAQRNKINAFYGIPFSTGLLKEFFSEPWRRTPQGEDALGWGTDGLATLQVEVDIVAGATSPVLDLWAEISDVRETMGIIKKMRRFQIGVTSVGDRQVQNLPRVGTSYYALHAFEGADGDITNVQVKTNNLIRFDAPSDIVNAVYGAESLTDQSGMFSVSFDRTRRVGDALSMANVSDYLLTATMANATDFTIVTEEAGPAS